MAELVTLKAIGNYLGNSSMIIGIRVESENIQTKMVKYCNSSYFTMVVKDSNGKNVAAPGLLISNQTEVKRFFNPIKQSVRKKERTLHEEVFDYNLKDALEILKSNLVKLELK